MNIAEYRNRIREDLGDTDESSLVYSDSAIDRAILSAIEDLSRWVTNDKYAEIVVSNSTQTETFSSTGIDTNTRIQLTNYPLRPGTEVITKSSPTVTYTRDTDYTIDYANGIITFPVGSAIIALADGITLTVIYEKSRRFFNLSNITDMRMITGVEVYNGSQITREESFELIGTYLALNSDNYSGEIPSGYRLNVLYEARHEPPDDVSGGTVPEILAELVIKGAEAALLYSKAIALEVSQSETLDNIGDLTSYYTTILSDLAASRAALVTALTRADAANDNLIANLSLLATDLASQSTAIAAAGTFIGNVNALLVAAGAAIDTEIGSDITDAISFFQTAAALVVSDISTNLTSALSFIDTEVNTDLGDAKTAATTTTQDYLDLGDDYIITINSGRNPPEDYANYAQVALKKAEQNIAVGMGRLKLAEEYVEIVSAKLKQVEAIFGQADRHIKNAELRLAQAKQLDEIASIYIESCKARLSEAQLYNERMNVRINIMQVVLAQAEEYIKVATGYQQSAQLTLTTINTKIAVASEQRAQTSILLQVAETIRNEATRRYRDFQEGISDKNQTRRYGASISRYQLT